MVWKATRRGAGYVALTKSPSIHDLITLQIFILEGALTVAVSFAFFFLLPDFPEESKWLRPDEKEYVAGYGKGYEQ